ncbi:STE/STE7 protein kinase [Aphanomyces invadans]|uniref:mitogen-activated protein kinase kinase n=1 Tax=Aphanomyces invadans TaxID=157072 RepID=A0A024UAU3_9STRA|nr:STE/STE7 protein kinase [Aphanomyces invadans]ETW02753.1 STE/STE7 protein kinase [Aphanomyces invadans]|eukprot:XP_008868137.1 STE/STE7 protein kinase [Aphanomyces invadans]
MITPYSTQHAQCSVDIDNLETLGLLGRGCSGTVLKAIDRSTNTLYAIKTVHNVYDRAQRRQILTEIQTLYSVATPWLVDFYGAFFKDHALSLILQYCDRGSLDALVRQHGAIPERILAHMTYQILSGLQHLKEARHFHRDIKPQNILVTSDGYVKLTDFGLARELTGTFDMAQTFVGTFKYMSPERVQNEPYDFSSDIWGVGLVLLECALAAYPYGECGSYIDVVQSILESPPPALPTDAFSTEFQDFLNDCLRKDMESDVPTK